MPIKVRDVFKKLGGREVLRGVSLEVGAGEVHVVIGPNGSGKTTLVKTIAGLLEPDSGSVYVDDVDVTGVEPRDRGVGVVLQGAPLLPLASVFDHIAFPLRARGFRESVVDGRVREVASRLGLSDKLFSRLERLSGGERQRVAIATAIVTGTRNLVLDEPFSSLDPVYRMEVYSLLLRLRRDGYSILVTTHIVDDLLFIADRIWVLLDGVIGEAGSLEELLSNPRTWYSRRILRHTLTGIAACNGECGLPGAREAGEGLYLIPYNTVSAVESEEGYEVVRVIEIDGARIAVLDTGIGIMYAVANPSLRPGDRAILVPRRG
ncbi:MAG: ABC transporter ATP-binding protein [Desulfurococcales archaeon]|nr:ABC transporter ATP-binding protein [Desulfurococcales archaeon]